MPLSFAFNANTETPAQLAERRRWADMIANQIGGGTSNWGEGIGDLLRGLAAGGERRAVNKAQTAGDAGAKSGMDRLMEVMSQGNQPTQITGQPGDVLARASQSIGGMESGNDYSATGPVTRHGDRAYGKYQVMGANIPDWTEAATGQRLTPEEFLAMPKAQEKVFQHRFGGYLKDHTPEDAASMWFTGKPLAQGAGLQDQLGTSGQGYADKFMSGMGVPPVQKVPELASYAPPPQQGQQPPPQGLPPQVMAQAPQMPPQAPPQPAGPAAMAPAQQAAAAQMQPAGNDAALIPQIMEMLRNQYITDSDRAFLQQRLDDIQKKQDPMYQMGLEKSQLELDAMKNPAPKFEHVGDTIVEMTPEGPKVVYQDQNNSTDNVIDDVNGRKVVLNKRTGEIVKDLGKSAIKQQTVPNGYMEDPTNPDGVVRRPGFRDTQLEMDMRKEFDAVSKDFRSVRDSYNRMQASAENPSPAGDLSLIFNYMKMLDPNSVVRESEFATAAAAGSFGERIQGAVSQVTNGQRLAPEIRADFLTRSEQLYSEQDQTFQSLADQYSETAKRNGLDPENIILTPRSNPRKAKAAGKPADWTDEEWNALTPEEKAGFGQ